MNRSRFSSIQQRLIICISRIVDMHSHLGVDSSPELDGAEDYNSMHGNALPWLRALDGLNTHDDAFHLSISGGVTTALILPGSGNSIGVLYETFDWLYSSYGCSNLLVFSSFIIQ